MRGSIGLGLFALAVFCGCAERGRSGDEVKPEPTVHPVPPSKVQPEPAPTGKQPLIEGYTIAFDRTSEFGRVLVGDRDGIRCMAIDTFAAGLQGCMDIRNWRRVVHPYTKLATISLAFVEKPERVLMIGLGAGMLVRLLVPAFDELEMDVVEIDAQVIAAADKYFGVRESDRVHLHAGDGRAFLEQSSAKWDVIILDAFGGEYIPYALTTREFMDTVKRRLRPGGVMVANVWSDRDRRFRAQLKTMASVFPTLYAFNDPSAYNVVIVGSAGNVSLPVDEIKNRAKRIDGRAKAELGLAEVAEKFFVPIASYATEDVPLLTDDRPGGFGDLESSAQ